VYIKQLKFVDTYVLILKNLKTEENEIILFRKGSYCIAALY